MNSFMDKWLKRPAPSESAEPVQAQKKQRTVNPPPRSPSPPLPVVDELPVERAVDDDLPVDDIEIEAALAAALDLDELEAGDEDNGEANASVSVGRRADALKEIAETLSDTSVSSFGDLLLSLSKIREEEKVRLRDFINETQQTPPVESLVPIDAFLEKDQDSRPDTHCTKIDSLWEDFVTELGDISDGRVKLNELAKPSGPFSAKLFTLWHYPSYTTKRPIGGHVNDPSSPCLKVQQTKIGLSPSVLTADMFPIRKARKPEFEDIFPSWDAIRRHCIDFNMKLTSSSRFVIVVGKHTFEYACKWFFSQSSIQVVKVPLVPKEPVSIFKQPAHYLLIKDKATGHIRQVVFFSYHGEFFLQRENNSKHVGSYHDMIWNAACEFSGIEINNSSLFTWKMSSKPQGPDGSGLGHITKHTNSLRRAMEARRQEEQSGTMFSLETVKGLFAITLAVDPELEARLDKVPPGDSYVREIVKVYSDKGHEEFARMRKENPSSHVFWTDERKEASREMRAPGSEWRASDKGQNSIAALDVGNQRKRDTATARYQAMLNTLDVKEILAKPRGHCDKKEIMIRDNLDKLAKLARDPKRSGREFNSWMTERVTFWTPTLTHGVRYEGDGGPDEPDPYNGRKHPGVHLRVILKNEAQRRAAFVKQGLM